MHMHMHTDMHGGPPARMHTETDRQKDRERDTERERERGRLSERDGVQISGNVMLKLIWGIMHVVDNRTGQLPI
jgi:hypothetical protein